MRLPTRAELEMWRDLDPRPLSWSSETGEGLLALCLKQQEKIDRLVGDARKIEAYLFEIGELLRRLVPGGLSQEVIDVTERLKERIFARNSKA